MQLKKLKILCILCICITIANAQEQDSSSSKLEPIEINFISNYYNQDGNHSPVGGGIGSEKLTNITEQISIYIPVKKNLKINLKSGVEFFSSASQNGTSTNSSYNDDGDRRDDDDDDDDEYYSGASQKATKRSIITYTDFGLSKENKLKHTVFGGNVGYYKDENATSGSFGTSFTKSSKDNNNTFNTSLSFSIDKWNIKDPGIIINGTEHLGNGRRESYAVSLSYSRVFNKRLTGAIITDVIYQHGLLSTPYHNVYFINTDTIPALERLPNTRVKFPVAARLNYHATDWLILRTYYRYYHDTWGINAHTINLEAPVKIGKSLRLYPFYRFHTQTSANQFASYQTLNSAEQQFYTADYDLSALKTHKMGLGISVTPINGFFKSKDKNENGRSLMMKSLDFRYAYYTRSDHLTGHMLTAGVKFEISRKD